MNIKMFLSEVFCGFFCHLRTQKHLNKQFIKMQFGQIQSRYALPDQLDQVKGYKLGSVGVTLLFEFIRS